MWVLFRDNWSVRWLYNAAIDKRVQAEHAEIRLRIDPLLEAAKVGDLWEENGHKFQFEAQANSWGEVWDRFVSWACKCPANEGQYWALSFHNRWEPYALGYADLLDGIAVAVEMSADLDEAKRLGKEYVFPGKSVV